MNLIAAVDRHWGIGRNGRLLLSIPEDQRLFRQETLGKTVTIVLSRGEKKRMKGAVWVGSVQEALEAVKDCKREDVFVAGGEEIYRAFLPYCDTAHVTFVDYVYEADAYFPDLDRDPGWVLDVETEEATYFDICYTFRRYVRRAGERGVEIEE